MGQLETFPALSIMSAAGDRADEISTIADVPVGMSAVGGIADVVCQGLSGPFLARSRSHHSFGREVGGADISAISAAGGDG